MNMMGAGGGKGFGGGGKWGLDDSARSYVAYNLANGDSLSENGGGHKGKEKKGDWQESAFLISVVFWTCMIVSTILIASAGISLLLALILALPISAVSSIIIVIAVIMIQARIKGRKKGGPDEL